jgi:hypothetical protein
MQSPVHTHFDRQERTDPITGHTIDDSELGSHPWLQEGDPDDGITIYFDNEETMREYAAIQVYRPEHDMDRSLDNPTDEWIDEG